MSTLRRNFKHFAIAALAISIASFAFAENTASPIPDSAFAQNPATAPVIIPPAPDLNANGYLLMDANTGQIIAQKNMDVRMAPASLTKLMTLYLTFHALSSSQIHLTDQVRISKEASSTGGSRMFVKIGTMVPVDDLLQGVIVDSGNDATVALAEYFAGAQSSFVPLMNAEATKLGMVNTHFMDATGLPDPQHYSSPHDLGILVRHIITEYPQYYHYFSQKWFTYNNIKQPNRNRLLWRDASVDGLKTGHTDEAGFCLITSAQRNGMRLIAVIMGAPTDEDRAQDNQALLDYGFRFYRSTAAYQAGANVTQARVWMGENKFVSLGVPQNVYVTLPIGKYKSVQANVTIPNEIKAPVTKGQILGQLSLTLDGKVLANSPLVALQDNPNAGIFSKLADYINLGFHHMFGGKENKA